MRSILNITPNFVIMGVPRNDLIAAMVLTSTLGQKLQGAMPNIIMGFVVLAATFAVSLWLLVLLRDSTPPGFVLHLLEWARLPKRMTIGNDPATRPLTR